MRDKYNLNTLPAGIAGLEDIDMGGKCIVTLHINVKYLITIYLTSSVNQFYHGRQLEHF